MKNYKLIANDEEILASKLIELSMKSDRTEGITIQEMDASNVISEKVNALPEGKIIDLEDNEWAFVFHTLMGIRFKRSEDSLIDFCKKIKEIVENK